MKAKKTRAPEPKLAASAANDVAVPGHVIAWLAAAAAIAILVSVSFIIFDPDLWQHLLVGKVIWQTKHVPMTEQWSWPTYGAPAVTPSWLFRALLWPFWAVGGPAGMWVWRWLATLGAFAIAWATCRRAGGRGHWALLAIVWCAIVYRHRSMPRPESLVVLLIAAQTWVLVRLRTRREDESAARIAAWLVPIAWAWANIHLSYLIGLLLTVIHALGDRFPRRREGPPPVTGTLALALLACIAVSFLNPFGWRALAYPFDYVLHQSHEPIYRFLSELLPIDWKFHMYSLLPLWLAAIGLLALWGWWRRGFDLAQLLVLAVFVPQAISSQRFLGPLSLLVAPFFARDFDRWAASRTWPAALRRPAMQGLLVLAGIAMLSVVAWVDPFFDPRWGINWATYPVTACDWMQAHDVRGRGFNFFQLGGYINWRFWPERDRLPFMDIHQAGTPLDRTLLAYVPSDSTAWDRLDAERQFDWAVVSGQFPAEYSQLERLDADTTHWALVHWDDAASLFLRRGGRMAELAERERYRVMPGGTKRLDALSAIAGTDNAIRAELRAELERAIASSHWNGSANSRLATIDQFEGRYADARRHLASARAVRKDIPHFDERMGMAWLLDGQPAQAIPYFERARRDPKSPNADLLLGRALQATGDLAAAAKAYRRAMERPETMEEARKALGEMSAKP